MSESNPRPVYDPVQQQELARMSQQVLMLQWNLLQKTTEADTCKCEADIFRNQLVSMTSSLAAAQADNRRLDMMLTVSNSKLQELHKENTGLKTALTQMSGELVKTRNHKDDALEQLEREQGKNQALSSKLSAVYASQTQPHARRVEQASQTEELSPVQEQVPQAEQDSQPEESVTFQEQTPCVETQQEPEPEQVQVQEPEPEQAQVQEPEPEQAQVQEPEQAQVQEPEQAQVQEPEQVANREELDATRIAKKAERAAKREAEKAELAAKREAEQAAKAAEREAEKAEQAAKREAKKAAKAAERLRHQEEEAKNLAEKARLRAESQELERRAKERNAAKEAKRSAQLESDEERKNREWLEYKAQKAEANKAKALREKEEARMQREAKLAEEKARVTKEQAEQALRKEQALIAEAIKKCTPKPVQAVTKKASVLSSILDNELRLKGSAMHEQFMDTSDTYEEHIPAEKVKKFVSGVTGDTSLPILSREAFESSICALTKKMPTSGRSYKMRLSDQVQSPCTPGDLLQYRIFSLFGPKSFVVSTSPGYGWRLKCMFEELGEQENHFFTCPATNFATISSWVDNEDFQQLCKRFASGMTERSKVLSGDAFNVQRDIIKKYFALVLPAIKRCYRCMEVEELEELDFFGLPLIRVSGGNPCRTDRISMWDLVDWYENGTFDNIYTFPDCPVI